MLTEDSKFCERLQGLIQKLTSDVHLREDLFQMAMIHLLHTESKEPHHTRSWFLNSCKFHLLDYLKKGRSVDALKRRHLGCPIEDADEPSDLPPEAAVAEDSVLSAVAAKDIVRQLSLRLDPLEAKVLIALAEGYGVVETAEKLNLSPPTVRNYRRIIVATAVQIGLAA